MDPPSGFRSYIMEPQGKTLVVSKTEILEQKREEPLRQKKREE